MTNTVTLPEMHNLTTEAEYDQEAGLLYFTRSATLGYITLNHSNTVLLRDFLNQLDLGEVSDD